MESLTDRIAQVSLQTVLLIVTGITVARVSLFWSRAAWGRSVAELLESVLMAVVVVFLVLRPFVVQSFFIPSGSMHPTLWEGDHILVNKWVYRTHSPRRGEVLVFRAPPGASADEKDFIKRLIGLPGDTIEVREGFVEVGRRPHSELFMRSEVRAVLGAGNSVSAAAAPPIPLRFTTQEIWLGGQRITREAFARAAGRSGLPVRIVPGRVYRNGEMLTECYIAEDPQYRWGPKAVPPGSLFVMGDNRNESHDSHVWGMLPEDRVIGRAEAIFWPLSHLKRIPCP